MEIAPEALKQRGLRAMSTIIKTFNFRFIPKEKRCKIRFVYNCEYWIRFQEKFNYPPIIWSLIKSPRTSNFPSNKHSRDTLGPLDRYDELWEKINNI